MEGWNSGSQDTDVQLSGAQELLYDLAAYSRCAEDSSNVGDIGIRARRRYSFGCYSFTWDRMEYNYSSRTLIFMHISMGAIMVVGLFNLSCCANLLCFLPSQCHQQTRSATAKSSSLFIIYTTSMIVLMWLVSTRSIWSENWYTFMTPPNACGHFVLAVVRDGSAIHEQVHIVYDERPTSVSTASIPVNLLLNSRTCRFTEPRGNMY